MKQLKKKLKNRSGFTLGEVLICVLILLLITAVVAGAMPVAGNAYYKVVDGANAQVLLSTTIAALRDELGTAEQIQVSADGKTITYRSASTGNVSALSVKDGTQSDAGGFYLKQYDAPDVTPSPAATDDERTRLLVSEKAATGTLYPVCESIAYDEADGVVTFTNLMVKKTGSEQPLASVETFRIRVVDPT